MKPLDRVCLWGMLVSLFGILAMTSKIPEHLGWVFVVIFSVCGLVFMLKG